MPRGRKTRISRSESGASHDRRADEELVARARAARVRAHSPYSRLEVGAAARDADGRIFTGCNVENASFGLTLCAERVAVVKAVSEGASRLVSMAIATDRDETVMPCGACRQVLSEFAPRLRLIVAGRGNRRKRISLRDLLPDAFGPADLP